MKRIERILILVLCIAVFSSGFQIEPFAEAPKTNSPEPPETTLSGYQSYKEAYDYPELKQEIVVFDQSEGIVLSEGDRADWQLFVEEAALGAVEIVYSSADDMVTDIGVGFEINGKVPFAGIEEITLPRIWKNDPSELTKDGYIKDSDGNELSPSQIQSGEKNTLTLNDTSGASVTPFQFAFSKGNNTVGIKAVRNAVRIYKIRIFAPEPIVSYREYLQKNHSSNYGGKVIIAQGEDAVRKSSSVLAPISDKSSPATSPSSAYYSRINTIGSSAWNTPGQWIEWEVETEEDGYYALGIKYRQNLVSGMFSTRMLTVNGSLPFAEAASLEFEYSTKWQAKMFADQKGDSYKIYLKKGKNTIRLTAVSGKAAQLYASGIESVEQLNSAYRQIIMLTGTAPDTLRNYKVDKNCPKAMRIITEQAKALKEMSEKLADISGRKGSANLPIDNLQLQLESFANDPMSIPSRIDAFRSNITSFSDAVYELSEQPLEIDYLTLSSPDSVPQEISHIKASFFERLKYEIILYLTSFQKEYSVKEESKSKIVVWTSTGRDQATVLKRLSDIKFTSETGIEVDLKMVASGTGVSPLLLATVSGFGPDVAIGLPNANAVDYALRDTAYDLSRLEGFSELTASFKPSAMTPFEYNGGYYALPLTQSFPLMFYRTDLLSELGIELPDTWNDFYRVIGELQKQQMTVGIPSDMSYLFTHIYQNGGTVYGENNKYVQFNTPVAMNSFSDWCNLYTSYGLPLDYDSANRFRTGEMPLIIADYSFYNTISLLAPEIKGSWGMSQIPGTKQADGTINRVAAAAGTCAILLSTTDKPDASWQFLKWLVSDEIQSGYARSLESRLGIGARCQTANVNVLSDIPWTKQEYEIISSQWENTVGIPEVPGGYYVSRSVQNALRNVVSYQNDPQEILKEYASNINDEIAKKREQYNLE